ncbi:hypothetical protein C1H46_040588 [Malus baccata]|uniref:Uncharacterized protein n=1 Tax=Malus baccata TaxID=106549 RepID=A0A540KI34_MALBA|nr:hypothetical protein C1H46_040588 [Malus baccata]
MSRISSPIVEIETQANREFFDYFLATRQTIETQDHCHWTRIEGGNKARSLTTSAHMVPAGNKALSLFTNILGRRG